MLLFISASVAKDIALKNVYSNVLKEKEKNIVSFPNADCVHTTLAVIHISLTFSRFVCAMPEYR